jgi:4-aminobutyrate aminotransferase-like enzyme
LEALHKKYPKLIREVRGVGLMIGIEFVTNELGYEFSKGVYNGQGGVEERERSHVGEKKRRLASEEANKV